MTGLARPRWLTSVIVDVVLIAAGLADGLLFLYGASPWEIGVSIVGAVGLGVRRRWPWVSLLLALPALALVSGFVPGLVALYSVALGERRRPLTVVAGACVLAASFGTWWEPGAASDMIASLIYATMAAAAPIALGLLVRTRRELMARVEDLQAARLSERRHVEAEILAAERARMAREMHDVVSSQVSLLAVQAGALQVATDDPAVEGTARIIRSLAVKTLDELRQMVGVLRAGAHTGSHLAPRPTVADLPALVAASGIPARVDLKLPEGLSASVQLAVYRTVQEALTNIRKHAPGATATVTATAKGGLIEVVVHNTRGTEPGIELPRAGHGLLGLRERAELLDGTLSTSFESDGAHVLTLRIPRAAGPGARNLGC
ncbi:MAG: histidine kinase [Bifidobacteriaceae bacterium]|jgi:signal transduction histidine kinase|nr:histidine kinase [Bifidobacteriaceae bacterium]